MAELFTLKVWVLSRDHNDIIIYHKFRVFVVVWALQLCEKGCVCVSPSWHQETEAV